LKTKNLVFDGVAIVHGPSLALSFSFFPLSLSLSASCHLHTNLFARAGGTNRNDVADYLAWRAGVFLNGVDRSLVVASPRRATFYTYICSSIMSSVNNHRAWHARTRPGLRAMLTGLCGKSWRQKYLPSGDSYIRESTSSIGSRRVSSFLCRASPTIGNFYGSPTVIFLSLINAYKLEYK